LEHARLAAFGSTCHPRRRVEDDPNLKALVDAGTPVVTIFGKTWDLHVRKALGSTLEENLSKIAASICWLRSKGREVVRVLDSNRATAARVRVLIDSTDGVTSWRTVGVSDNILDASFQALQDSVNYRLMCERAECNASAEEAAHRPV